MDQLADNQCALNILHAPNHAFFSISIVCTLILSLAFMTHSYSKHLRLNLLSIAGVKRYLDIRKNSKHVWILLY